MRRFLLLSAAASLVLSCSSADVGGSSNDSADFGGRTGGPVAPGGGGSAGSGGGGTWGAGGAGGSSWGADAGAMFDAAAPPAYDASKPSEDAGGDAADDDAGACAALDSSKSLVLYQSADDSNSMASPALVRKAIRAGGYVDPSLVRTYEFFNYYRIAYTPADAGHVRVVPELRPSPDADGEYTLQIGLQSELAHSPRRQMNIALVLDTSGSMAGDRIARERAAVNAIIGQMRQGDLISMVTWNTANQVLFDAHQVSGPNDPALLSAVANLDANGGTDLDSGLQKGYAIAQAHYDKSLMNRVVLISDGEANVGVTAGDVIGKASHSADDEGIYLVGVNVGDAAGDALMNIVTDMGRGASVFLDSEQEAAAMFGARFDETMEIAARGVRLELTLPWYMTMKKFSGEQSSTNPKDVDPQHLAPSDAMVFYETFLPCDPSVVDPKDAIVAKATYETPILHAAQEDSTATTIGELLAAGADHLAKGRAIYAYAEALKAVGGLSGAAAKQKLNDAIAVVDAADPGHQDAELAEIRDLLALYATRF